MTDFDECSGAAPEQSPLTDQPAVRNALRWIVARMERNFHNREDLLQDALVYLWSRERQCPGQQPSWYLQGVKFYLDDLRTSGRSLDSPKRRDRQVAFPDHYVEWDHWRDSLQCDDGIMSQVNARDTFSLLANRLKPIDVVILGELAQGMAVRDIADKLHVSHMFVVRHRRLIARFVIKLRL